MAPDFSHITTWVFDLDNTLYSPHSNLFPQIHARMDQYIQQHFRITPEEASKRRSDYFHTYGTSLRGMMVEESITPDHFLDFCHDIDLSALEPDMELARLIEALPGRKVIFTNADNRHARRILEKRDLLRHFEAIFDIADGNYVCKPQKEPYETMLRKFDAKPAEACMFDDMEANLIEAAGLGMTTVWLRHEAEWLRRKPGLPHDYPHCHYVAEDDIIPFLKTIVDKQA
jgi:putative hydrolase of the HAD superfamily